MYIFVYGCIYIYIYIVFNSLFVNDMNVIYQSKLLVFRRLAIETSYGKGCSP